MLNTKPTVPQVRFQSQFRIAFKLEREIMSDSTSTSGNGHVTRSSTGNNDRIELLHQEHVATSFLATPQSSGCAPLLVGNDQQAQNNKRKSKPSNLSHPHDYVNGWWLWELLGCVVASGFLAATFAVLSAYDGRPLSDWPYTITINSFISFFVTVLQATMLISVSEGK